MKLHRISAFLILAVAILALGVQASAGEKKIGKKDVPAAVIKAFEQAYPHAKAKAFAKEEEDGTTYYEIESVEGKTGRDLLYTADGKVAEIEETVALKALPKAVADAFAKESPKAKPTKIEKTTKGDAITYGFSMGKGKSEIVIDSNGKVLKESKAVKEKEEDEKGENED